MAGSLKRKKAPQQGLELPETQEAPQELGQLAGDQALTQGGAGTMQGAMGNAHVQAMLQSESAGADQDAGGSKAAPWARAGLGTTGLALGGDPSTGGGAGAADPGSDDVAVGNMLMQTAAEKAPAPDSQLEQANASFQTMPDQAAELAAGLGKDGMHALTGLGEEALGTLSEGGAELLEPMAELGSEGLEALSGAGVAEALQAGDLADAETMFGVAADAEGPSAQDALSTIGQEQAPDELMEVMSELQGLGPTESELEGLADMAGGGMESSGIAALKDLESRGVSVDELDKAIASGESARGRGGSGKMPFQNEMEEAYGADLSGINVLGGPDATQALSQVGSQGLAIGGDTLVLPDGASKDLVAEEVGHLMQAGLGSSGGGLTGMSSAGDAAELEARNAAHEVASGGTASLGQSPRARMAARPGDPAGIGGDLSHAIAKWIQQYLPYNSWGNAGADLATDLIPGVSNVKDAIIAITGVNPVTGERAGVLQRIFSGICAIPGLGNIVKYVGKAGKGLFRGAKWLGKWGWKGLNWVRKWGGKAWKGVSKFAPKLWKGVTKYGPKVWSKLKKWTDGARGLLNSAVRHVVFAGQQTKKKLGELVNLGKKAWSGVWNLGQNALSGGENLGKKAWSGAKNLGRKALSVAGNLGQKAWSGVGNLGQKAWSGAKNLGQKAWSGAKNLGQKAWSGAKDLGQEAWSGTKSLGKRAWGGVKSVGKKAWGGVKSVGKQVTGFFSSLF